MLRRTNHAARKDTETISVAPADLPFIQRLSESPTLIGSGALDESLNFASKNVSKVSTGGLPASLLCIPYVAFSLILILLVIASFMFFHRKNGHRYRRRKSELWNQLNIRDFFNQLQRPFEVSGLEQDSASASAIRASSAPTEGSLSGKTGGEMAGQRRATATTAKTPFKALPSRHCIGDRNADYPFLIPDSNDIHANTTVDHIPPAFDSSIQVAASKQLNSKSRRKGHKLTYVSNSNGSMVDIRVGEEQGNIFQGFTLPQQQLQEYGERSSQSSTVPLIAQKQHSQPLQQNANDWYRTGSNSMIADLRMDLNQGDDFFSAEDDVARRQESRANKHKRSRTNRKGSAEESSRNNTLNNSKSIASIRSDDEIYLMQMDNNVRPIVHEYKSNL